MRFKGLFGLSARKAPAVLAAAVALLSYGAIAHADSSHDEAQPLLPIELGTTGSTNESLWIDGIAYCFAGTLGGLFEDAAGSLYILSNNHVLAQTNTLSAGEPIIHPALLDGVCSEGVTPVTVAHLSDYVRIKFCKPSGMCQANRVDAAIAGVVAGTVDPDGEILDIGVPATTSASPVGGMGVQKSGRTTGHTKGQIESVDVNVFVCYDDPCDDTHPDWPKNIAYFVNQFVVMGNFSGPGDSGSLILECDGDGAGGCAEFPAVVGLLFAGGINITIANSMDEVSSALDIAVAGCGESCFGGGGGGGGKPPWAGGRNGNGSSAEEPLALRIAKEVKARHVDALLDIPGVVGAGIGVDNAGEPVIHVFTRSATRDADHPIPTELEGVSVQVIVTGPIRAF